MQDQVKLDQVYFTRLAVFANPEWKPEEYDGPPPQVSRINAAKIPNTESAWIATQVIKHDGPATNSPYTIDVECIATIQFADGFPLEQQQAAAIQIGHNVLYAACREAILAATGRQPWGPYTLGISFLKQEDPPPAPEQQDAK